MKENKTEKKDTKVRYLYALSFLIIRNVSNKGSTKLTNKKNEIIIMKFIAFSLLQHFAKNIYEYLIFKKLNRTLIINIFEIPVAIHTFTKIPFFMYLVGYNFFCL